MGAKGIPQKLRSLLVDETVLEEVLLTIGDASSVSILLMLSQQDFRFTALRKELGVSSKTLSARLKRLEKQQLVVKTLYAEVPPRSVYSLSDKGRELISIFHGILDWEQTWKNR